MTTETFKNTFSSPPKGCIQTQMLVCDGAARMLEKPLIDRAVRESMEQADQNLQHIKTNQVLYSLTNQLNNARAGFTIANVATRTVNAAAQFVLIGGSTIAFGPLLGPIVGTVAAKSVEELTGSMLNTYTEETYSSFVQTSVSQLVKIARTNADDFHKFVDVEGTSFEKANVRLGIMQKYHTFLQDPGLDPTGAPYHQFNAKVSTSLAVYGDLTKEMLEQLNDQAKLNGLYEMSLVDLDKQTQETEKKVTRLTDEFYNFTESTNSQLKRLLDDAGKIQTTLNDVNIDVQKNIITIKENEAQITENGGNIAENAGKIAENSKLILENRETLEFVEEFMYGQMSPNQQIQALESGRLSHLPNKDKLLEAAETKQNFMQIQKYAQGAKAVVGLFKAAGIKVDPKVEMAVEGGTHLVNMGLSLATGNYIGAIGALTGLAGLGKKKSDPALALHKQTMKALGDLMKGQKAIAEGINSISKYLANFQEQMAKNQKSMFEQLISIEGQIDQVLENQEHIFERIIELDRDIKANFKELTKAVARLSHKVSLGHFNIYFGHNSEVIALERPLNDMYDNNAFDRASNCFTSYVALEKFLEIHPHNEDPRNITIKNSLQILKNEVMPIFSGDSSGSSFRMNNLESQNEIVGFFLQHYIDYRALVKSLHTEPSMSSEFCFVSNIFPSSNVQELNDKLELSKEPRNKWMPERFDTLFRLRELEPRPTPDILLSEPYSFSITNNHVIAAIRFHFLYDVWDSNYNLLPLDILSQKMESSRNGRQLLEDTILRLEVLLAQVTFRSGDCYLPEFVKIQRQGSGDKYDKLQKLLAADIVLANNVFMYGLREEVLNRNQGSVRYFVARNLAWDPVELQKLTDTAWDFQYVENRGWFVNLASHQIALPNALTLQRGQLLLPEEVRKIMGLRQRVIEELIGYSFPHSLTDEKTRAIYMASVYSNIKRDEVA